MKRDDFLYEVNKIFVIRPRSSDVVIVDACYDVAGTELKAERAEVLDLLHEVECLKPHDMIIEYPFCGGFGELPTHEKYCRLAALIKKLEAE